MSIYNIHIVYMYTLYVLDLHKVYLKMRDKVIDFARKHLWMRAPDFKISPCGVYCISYRLCIP